MRWCSRPKPPCLFCLPFRAAEPQGDDPAACRRGVQRFRETLTTIFSFDLDPPGLRLRELWWQGVQEGNGKPKPAPQRLLVARGRIDEAAAVHRPPRHLNGLGAGSRHCLRALIFADTGKGARFDVPATMLPFNIKHNPPNGGRQAGTIHLAKRGGLSRLLIDRSAARDSVSHRADPQMGGITA